MDNVNGKAAEVIAKLIAGVAVTALVLVAGIALSVALGCLFGAGYGWAAFALMCLLSALKVRSLARVAVRDASE